MRYEAVVFDFDGTLIQSADAKHAAFYRLFPDEPSYREIVAAVLADDPDGSRHVLIPRMLAAIAKRGLVLPAAHTAIDRIGAYAQAVYAAQITVPECPGASDLLSGLHGRTAIYVSSNTPEADLTMLLEKRGWAPLLAGWFGHPRDKGETVAALVSRHGGDPARIAVVGDGESDERAAAASGCPFFRVCGPRALAGIATVLEGENV
jgi:phosphoglycolate phosphatase-like HAD superfamily hydrolase